MDIEIPGLHLRDRRIAASDEYLDGDEGRERDLFNAHEGPWNPRHPHSGRFIYGVGSRPRLASQRRPTSFDASRLGFSRKPEDITTVILHSTVGPEFATADLPGESEDEERGSYHRVDEIIANFVILRDGVVTYTHDVEHILSVAGGRKGIDIEFAGTFPHRGAITSSTSRLSPDAIRAGRHLIEYLKVKYLRNLSHVHPHGQVQSGDRGGRGNGGKFDSCPGPDVWVNVGEWAVDHLGLISGSPEDGYPNHGISRRQSNPDYRQEL